MTDPGVDPRLAKVLDIKTAPERPDRRKAPRPRDSHGRILPKSAAIERQVEAEAAAIAAAPNVSRETPDRRPTASAGPTRGRPAAGIEATAEDGYVDDGLTRRNLDESEGNTFEIPAHLRRRGWAYQWQTTSVLMQPADPADMGFSMRQGWRPCTDRHIRNHFMPPGYDKETIEQRGQILLTRPERLDREAAKEMRKKADEQKLSKMRAALAAPTEQSPLMPRAVTRLEMEGEVGAYADDPISRER